MIFEEFSSFFCDGPTPCTQMDLLKPLLGAERTIDTIDHYYKRTPAPGNPRDAQSNGIQMEFLWNFIFYHGVKETNQIQNRSHIGCRVVFDMEIRLAPRDR